MATRTPGRTPEFPVVAWALSALGLLVPLVYSETMRDYTLPPKLLVLQGVLALTFADPASYDLIGEDDRLSVVGLDALAPDQPVTCILHKPDGSTVAFETTQTLSPGQIDWFKAGSALNLIKKQNA